MNIRLLAAPVLSVGLLLWQTAPAPAEGVTAADLAATLRISDMLAVMQQEGIEYGADVEAELFPGAGGKRWNGIVALIYDHEKMGRAFEPAFAARLGDDPAKLEAIVAFFGSDRGKRILDLEIEARRALLDDAVEEAAQVAVEEMQATGDPRFAVLEHFAEANDLIEENVSGALNANLAFYQGMSEGGAFRGAEMTEDDILAEVWGQEEAVRADTVAWLYPYLMLAYEPLSDEDMEAYIAFSKSAAGAAMNAGLFAGYNALFDSISRDLGRAAAEMLSGQDI